jgi:hypothetical protein
MTAIDRDTVGLAISGLALFIGGGAIGRWVARARRATLLEELRNEFVTVDTLNGATRRVDDCFTEMRGKVAGSEAAAKLAVTNSETALDKAVRIEQEQKHQWERTLAEVITPMRAMVSEQIEMGKLLAAQTTLVEQLTKQVDRVLSRIEK